MPDNVTVNGVLYSTDEITSLNGVGGTHGQAQRVKTGYGSDGSFVDVTLATPLPTIDPDVAMTGTISATDSVLGNHPGTGSVLTGVPTGGSYFAYPVQGGDSGFTLRLSGNFGGGTVWMESSVDSTNGIDGGWVTNLVRQSGVDITFVDASLTTPGVFRGVAAGYSYLRVRVTGATTPNIGVTFRSSGGTSVTAQVASLPAGANSIGSTTTLDRNVGPITLAAVNAAATIDCTGMGTILASIPTNGSALIFEAFDGVNWRQVFAFYATAVSSNAPRETVGAGETGVWRFPASGWYQFRVRVTAYTSNTIVYLNGNQAAPPTPAPELLAEGTNFMDLRQGNIIMARTAGAAGANLSKVPIVDGDGNFVVAPRSADQGVTATAAAGTAVTATLPAVVGKFHYITFVSITRYAAGALTGAAAPYVVTSTNTPGSMAWTFDTAGAIGTAIVRERDPALPIKSSVANTVTTIVCPATTNVIWRVSINYYVAA